MRAERPALQEWRIYGNLQIAEFSVLPCSVGGKAGFAAFVQQGALGLQGRWGLTRKWGGF